MINLWKIRFIFRHAGEALGILPNRCSEICRKFFWEIPLKKFLFNKVAGFRPATLLKMNLFGCIFQGFLLPISQNSFLKNNRSGYLWVYLFFKCFKLWVTPTFLLEDAKTCEITGSPPTFLLENAKTYEITDNSLVSSLLLLSLFCRPSYWKCLLVSLFSEYSNRPTIYLSYNADCVFWVFQNLTHHPYEQCWLRFGLTLPSDFSTLFMACEDWFIVTEKISI